MNIKSNRKVYPVMDDKFSNFKNHFFFDKVFVIDKNVYDKHPEVVSSTTMENYLLIDALELNKRISGVTDILNFFIENNVTRSTTVIAIGGGITQDLVSFATSIYYRGIKWAFYPTTLLAQADSCIGSKNCLNYESKDNALIKNCLGTFNPPDMAVLDYSFLDTLDLIDFKSGVGEIIKVHLMENKKVSEDLNNDLKKILNREDIVEKYIKQSLDFKKHYIQIDEFDTGYRNLLNYGHCFGHALEAASSYRLSHGMAVTLGMDIVNRYSLKLEYLSEKDYNLMYEIISKNLELVDQLDVFPFSYILKYLKKDKKNTRGNINMILTSGFGRMMKENIDVDILEECWNEFLEEYPKWVTNS